MTHLITYLAYNEHYASCLLARAGLFSTVQIDTFIHNLNTCFCL